MTARMAVITVAASAALLWAACNPLTWRSLLSVNLEKLAVGLVLTVLGVVLSYTLYKHAIATPAAPAPDAPLKKDAPPAAKRQLLYFGATWCAPCRKMQGTLADAKTIKALADSGTDLKRYDVDKDKALSQKYVIKSVPTYILLDPAGKELRRATGYRSPADFASWLTGKAEGLPAGESSPLAGCATVAGCHCGVNACACKRAWDCLKH